MTIREPHELVGLPYVRNGAAPEVGFDCFTLAAYVRRRWFDRDTPLALDPMRYADPQRAAAAGFLCAIEGDAPAWVRCDPAPGCVVGLARFASGRLHHCGVLTDAGVLHAMTGVGVMLTSLARLRETFVQVECFECRR